MNIGVSGAQGFIGKATCQYLNDQGLNVKKLSSTKNSYTTTYLDWNQEKSIEDAFSDVDILIHTSWVGSERKKRYDAEIQKVNVERAQTIVKVQKNTNISFVIALGSQDELSDGDQPWDDNAGFSPMSEYAKAKHSCFQTLTENIRSFAWARLFSVYGKGDQRDWIINNAVQSLKQNLRQDFGSCSQIWTLTNVKDVAKAFQLIINKQLTGAFNISSLEKYTLKDHLEYLQSLTGKNLFSFSSNRIQERDLSRTRGIIDSFGWTPEVSREVGFLELLS